MPVRIRRALRRVLAYGGKSNVFRYFFPKQMKGVREMSSLLNRSKLFVKRNASTILTCVGGAGVVVTTVMAVRATPKALLLLEEAKREKGEELNAYEVVAVAGPVYIPTALVGVSTITCIFGANILNKRSQAAITSAYALLNESYKDYQTKVEELYGKEVDTVIREEIAKDEYENKPIPAEEGKELFYDEYSKRYFYSTMYKVKEAEYQLNRDLVMRDYAYVNEFYECLGIEPIESGWELGWSVGSNLACYWQEWIDFSHGKMIMDDGTECHRIIMLHEPILDFQDYF
jgi:hypothetical protein